MGAEGALAAAQEEPVNEEVVEVVSEPVAEDSAVGGETVRAEAAEGSKGVVPEAAQSRREEAVRVEHPEGEGFFSGNTEEMSDAEAEEIARGQLARSGLLKGQTVRVAD
jgi:hypothetical protein